MSDAPGLVYEVDLEVETAIAADYRAWLRGHVAEILGLPGFLGATVSEVLEPAPPAGFAGLCVQYRLESEAACRLPPRPRVAHARRGRSTVRRPFPCPATAAATAAGSVKSVWKRP